MSQSTIPSTAPLQTRLTLIVTSHFNLAATTGFIDPFRAANYLDGAVHFTWDIASAAGGPCLASNGMTIDTTALVDLRGAPPDMVLISSSWTPEMHFTPHLSSALWRWAHAGVTLGGIDTGAFLLAQSGLLDGRRATVHYEHMDAFGERFPNCRLSEDLYVFDGNRISCAGGAASMDFALQIICAAKGDALANAAARYLFHAAVRPPGTTQNNAPLEPLGNTAPSAVKRAIALMEENLETPLSIAQICARVGISHRQMNRLFAEFVRKTPALYYRDIRLDRARGLVTQTELAMSEIALASGFASQVHFSRAYRERFGLSPSTDRIEGRVPFEFRAWPMHRKGR